MPQNDALSLYQMDRLEPGSLPALYGGRRAGGPALPQQLSPVSTHPLHRPAGAGSCDGRARRVCQGRGARFGLNAFKVLGGSYLWASTWPSDWVRTLRAALRPAGPRRCASGWGDHPLSPLPTATMAGRGLGGAASRPEKRGLHAQGQQPGAAREHPPAGRPGGDHPGTMTTRYLCLPAGAGPRLGC